MGKQHYMFNHEAYFQALHPQSVRDHHLVYVQRGAGLLSSFRKAAKFIFPVVKRLIVPHIKAAAKSTIEDIVAGKSSVKEAIKSGSRKFIAGVGTEAKNLIGVQQSGSGIKQTCKSTKLVKIGTKRKKSAKGSIKVKKTKIDYLS